MNEQTGPESDRSTYPMPIFANFTIEDMAAGEAFNNALGFLTLAVKGEDRGKLVERAKTLPGTVVAGPVDTDWLTTEAAINDPHGNQISVTAPRLTEHADAGEWVQQNTSGDFETPTSSLDPTQ
jgi:hypothetical protein